VFGLILRIMSSRDLGAISLILLAMAMLAHDLHASAPEERLKKFSERMKMEFSEVGTLSVDELAALEPRPMLLDVRAQEEFAVSRIPGAIRAEEDAAGQLQQLGVASNDPVVVYCSIGYRSTVLAEKLQEAGFTNVRNLEGSIFAWAHEGYKLVNENGPAEGVHPYNRWWGRYLQKSLWKWKPAVR